MALPQSDHVVDVSYCSGRGWEGRWGCILGMVNIFFYVSSDASAQ